MRFCVYRQWRFSPLQEVLEYFETYDQARSYSKTISKSKHYSVNIGYFG